MVGLSKEQKCAISVLEQHKPNILHHTLLKNAQHISCKTLALLPTGFVATSCTPIEKTCLPREQTWCWNQSNTKVEVILSDGTPVVFRKISPKKIDSRIVTPSYKLWIFQLQQTSDSPRLDFIWCEKGYDSVRTTTRSVDTEIGPVFPDQLSLEVLSFLRPFVEPEVAKAFGWD